MTEEQVRALYNSGAISMDSHYWHDGMGDWASITELTEAQPSTPKEDIGELRVADCLIKWNCPYCQERVSLDFKLLEQVNDQYGGKIACPSCNTQLGTPEIHANTKTVLEVGGQLAIEQSKDHREGENLKAIRSLNGEVRSFLYKQSKALKIISKIDLFLLVPTVIGVVFLLVDDSDWSLNPIQLCIPFALPRVWGIIVLLRILKTFSEHGIRELGPLGIYNRIMEWSEDTWWIPPKVDEVLPFPLYLLLLSQLQLLLLQVDSHYQRRLLLLL